MAYFKQVSFVAIAFGLSACSQEGSDVQQQSLVSTSLISYQLPLTLKLPNHVQIQKSNVSYEKGVVILGEHINLHVDMFEEYADSSSNPQQIKEVYLTEKKSEDDFVKIIQEDPQGFIYQTQDEELGSNFHFFYVQTAEKQQIEMTEGIPKDRNFSLPEIQQMYQIAQQAIIQK